LPNLIHVVFDNEVLLSVGQSFTTATASGSDIAAMAAAAGIPRTSTVHTVEAFQQTFREALQAAELTTLVAKVIAEGSASYWVDVHMLENRFAFQRYLRALRPPNRHFRRTE
jgi:sulfopyruvate decarboxylase subunit beta